MAAAAVIARPAPPRRFRCDMALPCPSSYVAALSLRSFGYASSSSRRPDLAARIRRFSPRRSGERVMCAYSTGAETITACSWNEYVICSDVPVLVEFWASWCGPCKMVHRLVDEIAEEYTGMIKCYKLDADDYPQTATSYNIQRVPTVLLFKDGEKIHSITGTLPKGVYVRAIEKSISQ